MIFWRIFFASDCGAHFKRNEWTGCFRRAVSGRYNLNFKLIHSSLNSAHLKILGDQILFKSNDPLIFYRIFFASDCGANFKRNEPGDLRQRFTPFRYEFRNESKLTEFSTSGTTWTPSFIRFEWFVDFLSNFICIRPRRRRRPRHSRRIPTFTWQRNSIGKVNESWFGPTSLSGRRMNDVTDTFIKISARRTATDQISMKIIRTRHRNSKLNSAAI